MIKYSKIALLPLLLILITGCSLKTKLKDPNKPKIDTTLETVSPDSIKFIADITSLALEWKPVSDPRATGYNIYRMNTRDLKRDLKLIEHVENRFSSHYVDKRLTPSTEYTYAIAVTNADNQESKATESIQVATLPSLEPVAFIQALSNQPRQVKILWRPHTNPSVSDYMIEKLISNGKNNKEWKPIKKLENRFNIEYIDSELKDNTTYVYRVKAITFEGAYSKPTLGVKATTKELPVEPTDLIATRHLPKRIHIKWTPSPTKDVIKYRIYRSNFENASYTFEKEVNKNTNEYTDKFEQDGKKVFYKVTALDVDGLETSLNVTAAMGQTLPKPRVPVITLAQIQDNRVILNWKPGDNRAVSFIVYKTISRGFFNNKTLKFINIRGNRYEDKDIEPNVEYTYAIQAVDQYSISSKITPKVELVLPKEVKAEPISDTPPQR